MRIFSFAVFLLPLTPALPAQEPHHEQLGTVRFPVSCNAPAQEEFNRAVALLHSFVFPRAVAGFQTVLRLDHRCTMAEWGLALSAWGNPFAAGIKPKPLIERGLAAIQAARATPPPTERERGYLDAAARLFEGADSLDQRARVLAYRDAMARLAAREPADTEAMIFHAMARAFTADPSDKTYAEQLAAGATLERLFAVLPAHPGLAHYIIHGYDVPALAGHALEAAREYSRIAPAVSHALHMPSHTYTRVGDWQASIDANIASAVAARREGATAEELHAGDYQAYAYLQTGQDRAAQRALRAVRAAAPHLDPAATTGAAPPSAGFFAIAAVPARYALERGAWAEAARLPLRPSPVPFADATTWFARALGSARSGDTSAARKALDALARLRDSLASRRESYWTEQVEIQRRAASAWLLFASGKKSEALAEMQIAAEREDATEKNAITPGPLAPARELLGEMLLQSHQPVAALTAFETALRQEPNRFRSLAGAARAAAEAGNRETARRHYARLLELCVRADRPGRPELVLARKAIADRN